MPKRNHVAEKVVLRQEERADKTTKKPPQASREIGGYNGPEPTRFGDWEKKGRCIDF